MRCRRTNQGGKLYAETYEYSIRSLADRKAPCTITMTMTWKAPLGLGRERVKVKPVATASSGQDRWLSTTFDTSHKSYYTYPLHPILAKPKAISKKMMIESTISYQMEPPCLASSLQYVSSPH